MKLRQVVFLKNIWKQYPKKEEIGEARKRNNNEIVRSKYLSKQASRTGIVQF